MKPAQIAFTRPVRALLLLCLVSLCGVRARARAVDTPPSRAADALARQLVATTTQSVEQMLRHGTLTMTLADIVQRAIEVAPELQRERALRAAGEAVVSRTELDLLPRLRVSAGYRRFSEIELALPAGGMAASQNTLVLASNGASAFQQFPNLFSARAELSFSPTEFLWLQLPSHQAARATDAANRARMDAERAATARRAIEAAYAYMQARAQRHVAQAAEHRAEAHLSQAQLFGQAGTLGPDAVLAARAAFARSGLSVTERSVAEAQARAQLASLLRERLPDELGIAQRLDRPTPRPREALAALTARARIQRPELRALRSLVTAQDRLTDAAQASRLPQLSLSSGVDLQNPAPRRFPVSNELGTAWDVGVGVSWSPNAALAGTQRVREAEAETARARADLATMSAAIEREVAVASAAYEGAGRAQTAAQRSADLAHESYLVHRERFAARSLDAAALLRADETLSDATLSLVVTAIQLRLAEARLDYALGNLP